jgi:transposase-like protein
MSYPEKGCHKNNQKQDRIMRQKNKKEREVISYCYPFAFKKTIVEEIENGLISINQASVRYNLHRSTVATWYKKYGNFSKRVNLMSKPTPKEEIKELKTRLRQLEAQKALWQDLIEMLAEEYGPEIKKKHFPGILQKDGGEDTSSKA